jgi:hypothetical protein
MDREVAPLRPVDEAVGENPQFPPRDATGNPLPRPGVRGAAGDIVQATEDARSAAANPHYSAAFNSGVQPDVSPVVQNINDLLNSGRFAENSASYRALTRARGALTTTDQDGNLVPITNYEGQQDAKFVIDNIIRNMSRAGEASPAEIGSAERALVPIQRDLTNTLRNAHPEYEAGYQSYIANSPAVQAIRQGGVGQIANMDGNARGAVLDSIFASRNVTPQQMAQTRAAFLINGRISEFNDALRGWMENRLDAALTPLRQGGQPGNVAGSLYQSIRNDPQWNVISEALPGGASGPTAQNLNAFFRVLQAASRTLPEGSPTATDLATGQTAAERAGSTVRAIGNVLSPGTYLEAGEHLANMINRYRVPAMRRQLAQAMIDPDSLNELARLRMMSPSTQQAVELAGRFLTLQPLGAAGGYFTAPGNFLPDTRGQQ